jgi:prepilin-type N-terminal cleavage/methylation domain-containing protein
MNQKKTAFTLIELLVVIVIIGILATIGVAQFNDYQEKARFAKAQAFAAQTEKLMMASLEDLKGRYLFDDKTTSDGILTNYAEGPDCTYDGMPNSVSYETSFDDSQSIWVKKNSGFLKTGYKGTTFSLSLWVNPKTADWDKILLSENGVLGIHTNNKIFWQHGGTYYWFPEVKDDHWHHVLFSFEETSISLTLDGGTKTTIDLAVANQSSTPTSYLYLAYVDGATDEGLMIDNVHLLDGVIDF